MGWEQVLDYNRGVYYVNHVESKLSTFANLISSRLLTLNFSEQVQVEDPRLEWRALQEDMLRQYLVTAKEDLQAKSELVTIKQARLSLAQDEFNHLNTTLAALSNSTTSCKLNSPFVKISK